MLHPAMFLATCLATCPSGDEVKVEAYFYWLIAQNIARQVARGTLHCAMLQKSVAALPQSLRKLELDSTSCNACCNKNVARLGDCGVCYTMQFLVQLVSFGEFSLTSSFTLPAWLVRCCKLLAEGVLDWSEK